LPDVLKNAPTRDFQSLDQERFMSQSVQAATGAISLTVIDGSPTTTSLEVAQHFSKQHKDVLEKIAALSREVGPEFTERNFPPSEYNDSTGRALPAYRLTRDGFTLLAMGFTGKKALAFKLAYIDAFNRMERELTGQAPQLAAPATLSAAQAHAIKSAVEAKCKGDSKAYSACYHALYDAFKVPSYREIEAARFEMALSFIETWQYAPPINHQIAAAPMWMSINWDWVAGAIERGEIDDQDLVNMAQASTSQLFKSTCTKPKGFGEEVARQINQDLPLADLHAIATRSALELMLRVTRETKL
jgi:Rha family phage regulatory protein